jgi:hypothetical protein
MLRPSKTRFAAGDRVRATGPDFYSGVPEGVLGTASLIATIGGKSVYPDPCKLLVFVTWDEHGEKSVPRCILEHHKEPKS